MLGKNRKEIGGIEMTGKSFYPFHQFLLKVLQCIYDQGYGDQIYAIKY